MGPDAILIIAAHPDDEIIGAGARFPEFGGRLRIVHVTDGAPRNLEDARNAGFGNREDYAAARYEEALSAAAHGGIAPSQFWRIGIADQEASLDLKNLVERIRAVLTVEQPAAIYTHPYEGGHPDHDATAFAVHAAVRTLDPAPVLWEFASYHAGVDGPETGCFLPDSSREVFTHTLNLRQRALKRRMLDSFPTQRHVLAMFRDDVEAFRVAPEYDFTAPPHPGRLHYENYEWGMTGERFRQLAALALEPGEAENHATHGS